MSGESTTSIIHEHRVLCSAGHGAARKKFGDWQVMLDRFAALAESAG